MTSGCESTKNYDHLAISPEPLVDIGVNLSNRAFADDIEDILVRAKHCNVTQMVVTGTNIEESEKVIELSHRLANGFPDMLFTTVGLHPHHANDFAPEISGRLRAMAAEPGVVAIGETGLDFNRNFSSPKAQEQAFEAQLELAAELQLPVFMHERDAHQRQFEILKQYRHHLGHGVIHCFTGDRQSLFNYLDLDLHIGITGWICDERRGEELQQLVNNIPLQRLMLESDAPYLLPRTIVEKPKNKRNEPAYLPWVLNKVAEHREESHQQIAKLTTATARQFFGLPDPE